MASVTPVVDGFVLRKGSRNIFPRQLKRFFINLLSGLSYSALPMLIQAHARHILATPTQHRRGVELIPHQLIGNKTVSIFVRSVRLSVIDSRCRLWIQVNCRNTPFDRIEYREQQLPGAHGLRRGNLTSGCKALQGFQNKAGMISKTLFCYVSPIWLTLPLIE